MNAHVLVTQMIPVQGLDLLRSQGVALTLNWECEYSLRGFNLQRQNKADYEYL